MGKNVASRIIKLLLLLVFISGGCGPVSGLTHIVRAKIDIDLAETAGAKQYAIYEYEAATQYINKAKEEYGYSDFIAGDLYAVKASKYAKMAREKAEATAQTQMQ